MKKEKSKLKDQLFTVAGALLCVILVPVLILNLTLIVKGHVNEDEVPSALGYLPLIVLTDSMAPEISSGDLIICQKADAKEVKKQDIIAFFDPAGHQTSIVTHRVMEIIEEKDGIQFKTKGDNNNTEDQHLVPSESLVGIYRTKIAGLGHAAMFMQTPTGFVVCVVLPIGLMAVYDLYRRSLEEKRKEKDKAALLAELQALRAEKAAKEKTE